jgi:tetratricopeptide (TPR) repeat protein
MRFVQLFWFKQIAIASLLFNRREMAIRYWEKIRVLNPNNALVPASIAQLKSELGLTSQAIDLLKDSLTLDDTQSQVWYNLGFLQQKSSEHDLAIEAFAKAIELNEKSDLAMYGKALSLIKLGRVEQAIPLLKRNTELQPFSPYGWYQLAHVYYRLGDLPKLKKTISKVSRFEPNVAIQIQRETGVNAGVVSPFST